MATDDFLDMNDIIIIYSVVSIKKNTDAEFTKIFALENLMLFFAQRHIHHNVCFSLRIEVIGGDFVFKVWYLIYFSQLSMHFLHSTSLILCVLFAIHTR